MKEKFFFTECNSKTNTNNRHTHTHNHRKEENFFLVPGMRRVKLTLTCRELPVEVHRLLPPCRLFSLLLSFFSFLFYSSLGISRCRGETHTREMRGKEAGNKEKNKNNKNSNIAANKSSLCRLPTIPPSRHPSRRCLVRTKIVCRREHISFSNRSANETECHECVGGAKRARTKLTGHPMTNKE